MLIPWAFVRWPKWVLVSAAVIVALAWAVPVFLWIASTRFCTAGGDACGGGVGAALLLSLGSGAVTVAVLISAAIAYLVSRGNSKS